MYRNKNTNKYKSIILTNIMEKMFKIQIDNSNIMFLPATKYVNAYLRIKIIFNKITKHFQEAETNSFHRF